VSSLVKITVLPENVTVPVAEDQTVLSALLAAGINHTCVCGGNARCSTCRVMVLEGLTCCTSPQSDQEKAVTDQLRLDNQIRLACQTYVSNDITIRRLVLDEEDCQITNQLQGAHSLAVGKEKTIPILFADIRNFTPFTESLLPYDVVHVLNRYFFRMDRVIQQHGGSINNFIGDGLMAVFGLSEDENPTLNAVQAALEMLEEVEALKPYLEKLFQKSFDIGIGIHVGNVVVGTVGAASLYKTTVIGDAVNVASRIENANKELDTRLLISETVLAEVRDQVQTGKKHQVTFKGKSGQHTLYEIIEVIES